MSGEVVELHCGNCVRLGIRPCSAAEMASCDCGLWVASDAHRSAIASEAKADEAVMQRGMRLLQIRATLLGSLGSPEAKMAEARSILEVLDGLSDAFGFAKVTES